MNNLTEKIFKKVYWKNFMSIEEEFIQTEKFVAFDVMNYSSFSSKYLKLLLEIGSEIDILAKVLCLVAWNRGNVNTITEYRDCILMNAPEFERVQVVSEELKETPWENWSSQSPNWWIAYNKIKHERFGTGSIGGRTEPYYKFANLENVVKALMGLYQLEIYVLNSLVKKEGKEEGFSFLSSSLFSLDGEIWKSSNFHKEGGRFYKDHTIYIDDIITSIQ